MKRRTRDRLMRLAHDGDGDGDYIIVGISTTAENPLARDVIHCFSPSFQSPYKSLLNALISFNCSITDKCRV